MFKSKQQDKNISLPKLLDGIEKANKNETRDYTSGHLNHNHLFKLQTEEEKSFWNSGKNLKKPWPRNLQDQIVHSTTDKNDKKMKILKMSLMSGNSRIKSINLHTGPVTPINTPFTGFQSQVMNMETHQHNGLRTSSRSEELEFPELKLLKFNHDINYPSQKHDINYPSQKHEEEYQFVPGYMAGLTKSDQFDMFLKFKREILKTEYMTKDFFKNTSVENYEKKVSKELLKISHVTSPHFARLHIFREAFKNVCNNSSVFGNILGQIKSAYDLYIDYLLDAQSSTPYEVLMAEIGGMKKRAVQTEDVDNAVQAVKMLEHEAYVTLEKNEQLRNELKTELTNTSTKEKNTSNATKESSAKYCFPKLSDSFESKRCEVLKMCNEIQELEQDIRKNMTHAVNTDVTDQCIKDVQAEIIKLETSNAFLQRTNKELDYEIKRLLTRQKLTLERQEEIKHLMRCFLSSEDQ